MGFNELEDDELNQEAVPSVTKRSRFFTDAEKIYTYVEYQISEQHHRCLEKK